MGVFKKQGVSWVDYYVNGHHKRGACWLQSAGGQDSIAKALCGEMGKSKALRPPCQAGTGRG